MTDHFERKDTLPADTNQASSTKDDENSQDIQVSIPGDLAQSLLQTLGDVILKAQNSGKNDAPDTSEPAPETASKLGSSPADTFLNPGAKVQVPRIKTTYKGPIAVRKKVSLNAGQIQNETIEKWAYRQWRRRIAAGEDEKAVLSRLSSEVMRRWLREIPPRMLKDAFISRRKRHVTRYLSHRRDQKILRLYLDGVSRRATAKLMGCSTSYAQKLVNQYKADLEEVPIDEGRVLLTENENLNRALRAYHAAHELADLLWDSGERFVSRNYRTELYDVELALFRMFGGKEFVAAWRAFTDDNPDKELMYAPRAAYPEKYPKPPFDHDDFEERKLVLLPGGEGDQ